MKAKKIYLRTDYCKLNSLTTEATQFCRLINDRVIPVLTELGLFSLDKAFYYAEDSDRVYTDYKTKCMQGTENVPLYLQRLAEENINDELYSIVGDGWGTTSISQDVIKATEWKLTENGEQLCIKTEALSELCSVYVKPSEQEAYSKIQSICDELNKLTADKGLSGYEHIICCPTGGRWQVNGNINLKAFI